MQIIIRMKLNEDKTVSVYWPDIKEKYIYFLTEVILVHHIIWHQMNNTIKCDRYHLITQKPKHVSILRDHHQKVLNI